MDIHIEFGLASLHLGTFEGRTRDTNLPIRFNAGLIKSHLVEAAMLTRIVFTPLCVFVLVPGILFSVVASKSLLNPARLGPLTPQTATLTINEYLADPAGSGSGDLEGDANGDGIRSSADDEFVEIVNYGAVPLDVGLFTISDSTQIRFTIPAGKVIPPGESAVVFGGGSPTGAFGNATANGLVFTAGAGGLSLNNGGDTITLRDTLSAIVTSLSFGSSEGGANQSITRSPDTTGSFTMHSTAAGSGGSLFSPGARVNGSPFTTTDPVIGSISPEGSIAGTGDVTVTVAGMNFEGGSVVRVNGSPVSTGFSSAVQLVAQIPSSVTTIAGTYFISVQNPGGAISNAVPFTVLSQIGINEYLADPPDGLSGDANGDGTRDSAQDEFVEIVNRTGTPIDVSGFMLRDADALRFTFPLGSIIPAGEAAVIFGGGRPQGDFGNVRTNGLLFTSTLSLNNGGDTIELRNSSAVAVESITFGPTEGGANQSINRNPDLAGIGFALHSSIPGNAGRLFSPGTRVDGSAFTIGPRITSISPNSANQGAPPFDMDVLGNGFEGTSTVLIDGHTLVNNFIESGHLVAHVPASVTAASGAHSVQVRNESGNRSNAVTLTIIPPPPILGSVSPRVVVAGSGTATIFLMGLNFVPGAAVLIDSAPIPTTFVSTADLRATVHASFTAAVGTHPIVVRNSDGQQSNSVTLDVVQPATVITSISPANAIAGGPGFVMVIRGANFKSGAAVSFDRADLATTFKTSSELAAQVPASLIRNPGIRAVSARNPNDSPSNEVVFQVFADAPLIASLDPPSVIEGSGALMVAIAGRKFQPGAKVRVVEATERGAALDTTFIGTDMLRASVPAALTKSAGGVRLAVENPDLGFSNGVVLQVLIKDPLVINEYLADPADNLAGDANGDGTRSSSADEFVEILNRSAEPFDISGFKLSDADSVRHVFAAGTVVPPFETVVVFGGGTPTGAFGNGADNHMVFKASTGGLSLNNGGDALKLQDALGRVIQEIQFGPVEGGAGQSINRDPDGDGATFALHTIVAADRSRLFSPGSKATGQTFTIKPIVSSITPATIRVGSIQFTLSVSGTKFVPGAVVLLSGTELPTVFRSDTLLEAQVAANLVAEGGRADIRVKNPRGEISGAARLLIVDDPPRVTGVTPATTGTGAENLEVSISGERFQRGAAVQVQGQSVETRFVSSTGLVVIVPSPLLLLAAELPMVVKNADGNISNGVKLTVENGPLITRLSRGKIKSGGGVFELTVGGVAFKNGVTVFAESNALSTTFVNDALLIVRIPVELTSQPGVLMLQARNPDGGRSNSVRLKVK